MAGAKKDTTNVDLAAAAAAAAAAEKMAAELAAAKAAAAEMAAELAAAKAAAKAAAEENAVLLEKDKSRLAVDRDNKKLRTQLRSVRMAERPMVTKTYTNTDGATYGFVEGVTRFDMSIQAQNEVFEGATPQELLLSPTKINANVAIGNQPLMDHLIKEGMGFIEKLD